MVKKSVKKLFCRYSKDEGARSFDKVHHCLILGSENRGIGDFSRRGIYDEMVERELINCFSLSKSLITMKRTIGALPKLILLRI